MKKTKNYKFAVVFLTIVLCVGVSVFSYMFFNGLSGIRINPIYRDGQIKVALVGDSVTYGHSIKGWLKNNYPALLSDMLGDDYCVKSYGVSGSTVQPDGDQPYNKTKAYQWSHDFNCDILVFMLGSNDSKPENWKGADKFKAEYLTLLNSYIDTNNPEKVIICTPPKAYFSPDATGKLTNYDVQPEIVDEVAEIVRNIALENGYTLIDINQLTENRRELFGKDNVHPNNDGAMLIAKAVYEKVSDVEVTNYEH